MVVLFVRVVSLCSCCLVCLYCAVLIRFVLFCVVGSCCFYFGPCLFCFEWCYVGVVVFVLLLLSVGLV